jgi:aerobic carbon-monoxide dehydrogenase medium subunit
VSLLPRFEVHRARSVAEASELLARHGEDAIVYAGGTELLLLLKLGLAEYGHLVDIKPIAELRAIAAGDGGLRVGSAVTHHRLETAPEVRAGWPDLAAMARAVANVRVRTVGTLGGNLCFADPHSDPAVFLLASGAWLVCRRGDEPERRLELEAFVRGPFENALAHDELLVAVEVPPLPPGSGIAHERLAFHERPAVTLACRVRLDGGRLAECAIAVGSVGARAVRSREAEALAVGREPAALDARAFEAMGRLAADAADPVADAEGSVDYKRHLVRVLLERGLRRATAQAGANRPLG